jgi:signal transduction histidine kinase
MVVMHAQAAAADVTLTVAVAENVPQIVRLDPPKVGWAIASLVGNALRYVRHDSRRTRGSITVAVSYEPAESNLVVQISDDGPGIAPHTVNRLFNHDDPHGPSGLGLLLVHDIVVAHGGAVEVRSPVETLERGTSIRFTIPNR